jgi:hypothetical protein
MALSYPVSEMARRIACLVECHVGNGRKFSIWPAKTWRWLSVQHPTGPGGWDLDTASIEECQAARWDFRKTSGIGGMCVIDGMTQIAFAIDSLDSACASSTFAPGSLSSELECRPHFGDHATAPVPIT